MEKKFPYSFKDTAIWVKVNTEFDGNDTKVTSLQFEGEGSTDNDIPRNPILKEHEGEWHLFQRGLANNNGHHVETEILIDNEYTKVIISKILQVKDEDKPTNFK